MSADPDERNKCIQKTNTYIYMHTHTLILLTHCERNEIMPCAITENLSKTAVAIPNQKTVCSITNVFRSKSVAKYQKISYEFKHLLTC